MQESTEMQSSEEYIDDDCTGTLDYHSGFISDALSTASSSFTT